MKKVFGIHKSAYQRRSFEELAAFAGNVANLMATNPIYAGKAETVAELKTLTVQFREAIDLARDRATSRIIIKKLLREKVTTALDAIVDWLKMYDTGDPLWIISAGFQPVPKGKKATNVILEPPFNLQATPTLEAGQFLIKFRLKSSKSVKTNVVAYSADNGETWQIGTYGNSRGILLSDLPKDQVIHIKVRSLGAGSTVSGWSEVVKVYVF